MSPGKLHLQPAGAEDLPAIATLLSRRDERDNDLEDVRQVLFDLAPEHLRAWVAYAGDLPVGVTSLYLRRLRWGDSEKLAGYWAHLYVREDYRERMVFPQLMVAMVKGARAAGIEVMFTATRQPALATASAKLGFALLARRQVLLRPLRPLRLVAKHLGAPRPLPALGAPVDALYGRVATRTPELAGTEVEIAEPAKADAAVVELLEASGRGRISQVWTRDSFRRRFAGTIDGARYELLIARSAGETRAAVISRIVDRNNGIRAGVILDILAADADARPAAQLLLRHAHRRAFRAGAELSLCFDSLGTGFAALARPLGYRAVSERYHFLVWPGEIATSGGLGVEADHWRFAFSDHDAF